MRTHSQLIDVWESSSASVAIVMLSMHYGGVTPVSDPATLGLWWGALLFPAAQALVRWLKRCYDRNMDETAKKAGGSTVALLLALLLFCGCAGVTYNAKKSASVDIQQGPPCVICIAVDDEPCKVKIVAPKRCAVDHE